MDRRRSVYGLIVLVVIAALAGLRCGEKGTEPEPRVYGLTPDSVHVEVSSTQQFTFVESTMAPVSITWYVDGVLGGSPVTCMITPSGLFIAPYEVPARRYATITANVVLDSTVLESAKAFIDDGYGATFIQVVPDSESVGPGDSIEFTAGSGCALTSPEWSLIQVSGDAEDIGTIADNGTYVAPASVSDDFTLMVMVSSQDCPDKIGLGQIVVRAPQPFTVQLEDFADSSGTGIDKAVPCSGGGYAVTGLDVPGEWIEVPYEVEVGGTYVAQIHYAGWRQDILTLTLSETVCEISPPEVVFRLDEGEGLG